MDEINELLELHTLEELFEILEIEPRDVIEILLRHGYIELPDYVLRQSTDEEQEES